MTLSLLMTVNDVDHHEALELRNNGVLETRPPVNSREKTPYAVQAVDHPALDPGRSCTYAPARPLLNPQLKSKSEAHDFQQQPCLCNLK